MLFKCFEIYVLPFGPNVIIIIVALLFLLWMKQSCVLPSYRTVLGLDIMQMAKQCTLFCVKQRKKVMDLFMGAKMLLLLVGCASARDSQLRKRKFSLMLFHPMFFMCTTFFAVFSLVFLFLFVSLPRP